MLFNNCANSVRIRLVPYSTWDSHIKPSLRVLNAHDDFKCRPEKNAFVQDYVENISNLDPETHG